MTNQTRRTTARITDLYVSQPIKLRVEPQFHRALNDDMLVDVLQQIAQRLSYRLR